MARVKYDTTGRYADHPQEIHDLLSKLHFDTAHGKSGLMNIECCFYTPALWDICVKT